MTDQIKDLKALVAHMESVRQPRLNVWRELHEFIVPHAGVFDGEQREKLNVLPNGSPQGSLRRGAAGLTSAMTPRGLPWFRLGFAFEEIAEMTHARAWLDVVERVTQAAMADGGWYQAVHAANQEFIGYGCMLLYTEQITRRDFDGRMRTMPNYSCCTVGSYCVALSAHGTLDTVVRTLSYTAQELKERFGEGVLSKGTQELLKKTPYKSVDVVHVVRPNPKAQASKADNVSMPWQSVFYEREGGEGLLSTGGYTDMPYLYARWNGLREQTYGTGPGDEALPDAKMLQAMEIKKLVGIDKTIDPPMRAPMGFRGDLHTTPGAVNPINSYENNGLAPLYEVSFVQALQAISADMTNVQRRIDDSLLASVFADPWFDQMPNVTATAIITQRQQKAQLMGPALSAYENTVLSRAIMRTITLLDLAGELPPVPPPLDKHFALPKDIVSIDYISPLSQSLRATNAQATQALVMDVGSMAQMNPQVLDKLNLDQAVDELAKGVGAPGAIVRSDEEVATIRQQRAEAQAQAEQMQVAQQAAAMIAKAIPAGAMPPQQ